MTGRSCSVALLVILILPLAGEAAPEADRPTLDSAATRIEFDPTTGRLTSLLDRARSVEAVADTSVQELWSFERADGRVVGPRQGGRFSWSAAEGKNPGLRLTWSELGLPDAPELEVRVEVRMEGNGPGSRWRIALENLAGPVIRSVQFPRLGALRKQEGEILSAPVWMGEQTRVARSLLNPPGKPGGRWQWEYPGMLSMQFLDWSGPTGAGLLLSTDDADSLGKRFAVAGDGHDGVTLEVVHLPRGGPSTTRRYSPPYDVLVTPHGGGWFGASQAYATWAGKQSWVQRSRMRARLTPAWLRDTGLWVWNRGRSAEVLRPAAALQERAGLPVSVQWHWWHGCAYDAGFPEYLPPREGAPAFSDALADAHKRGLRALVYMNQRLWGMTTASWAAERAERFAVKGPDGKVKPEVYNKFLPVPCAPMCMGTDFWRAKYAGLATSAVTGLGVDGIYMDQACTSLACYDPSHGHPPGGGRYWMDGFRSLVSDIRQRCAPGGSPALAGEGCGEAWLPCLDAMLSLQVSMERYAEPGQWEPVPLFQAVYHDCAILYGNYSSLTRPPYDDLWPRKTAPKEPLALLDRKFSTQFRLEQARAFAWGQQPTLANFGPGLFETRGDEVEFVLRLARLRRRLLPFLQDGQLLRPLEGEGPELTIPMSRLSIYAGQGEAVKEFTRAVSQVISAVWKSPDGRVAVGLVNIGDTPTRLPVRLDAPRYPIAAGGKFEILEDSGASRSQTFGADGLRGDVTLRPASAIVLVFPGAPPGARGD